MVNLNIDSSLKILEMLGECPSTSFHENLIFQCIKRILSSENIPFKADTYGNILARIEGTKPQNKPVAFVAHMDHPGFEVDRIENGQVIAKALGGVPIASIKKTTKSFSFDEKTGERYSCFLGPGASIGDREVLVDSNQDLCIGMPIVFDLPDFLVDGELIQMRAMDDLAGCAAIISGLSEWNKKQPESHVYAVFTRAEEVGLVGARLLAKEALLTEETLVISVETSSVIPGVKLGDGPVIRTGDASYTFDFEAENVLASAKERILLADSAFKCQRQLMSAGSCEAGAFMANGYKSSGIAFPLGNWHNATTYIADPDGEVGLEYIAMNDFVGGVRLILESPYAASDERYLMLRKRYVDVSADVADRLTNTQS